MKYTKSPTLESILQNYFNCKKPFLKNPYYDEEERAPITMTANGSRAYSKLIHLIYDIGSVTGRDVNHIVDELDSITSEL